MKKLYVFGILILTIISSANSYCQLIGNLKGIYYQAVALDENGKEIVGMDVNGKALYEKAIGVRFTITKDLNGPVQYQETHTVTTDKYGLFSLMIGLGQTTGSGSYSKLLDIPWINADQFLKVEVSTKNDGKYVLVSNQQFMSVPYSFYTDDIADDAITSAKILNGTIVTNDISDNAVTSEKILNGTIANNDIANSTIDLSTKVTDTLAVQNGGTGAGQFLNNSLIVGNSTGPLKSLGPATDGQIPIGVSGGMPVLASLTAGTGVTIKNTPGNIEISSAVSEITSDPAGTFVIGNLPAGTTYTSNAINAFEVAFGDVIIGSIDRDLQGCMLTAYVSQPNVIRISIYNGTGGPVNLGTVNVRVMIVH